LLTNDPNHGAETCKAPSVSALRQELLDVNSQMSCNPHSSIPLLDAVRSEIHNRLSEALAIEMRKPESARQLAGKSILAPDEPARC
jgi:hypothetical protein